MAAELIFVKLSSGPISPTPSNSYEEGLRSASLDNQSYTALRQDLASLLENEKAVRY